MLQKEILEFLDKNRSDEFPPKDIAKGLGKISKRDVNNITRLLRKLLAACDVLQPKEIKGKYGCIPFWLKKQVDLLRAVRVCANERSTFFAKNIVNEMKEVEQNTETSAY